MANTQMVRHSSCLPVSREGGISGYMLPLMHAEENFKLTQNEVTLSLNGAVFRNTLTKL